MKNNLGKVLSDRQIIQLIEGGAIPGAEPVLCQDGGLVNPGSLDLKLGTEATRLIGSIKPLAHQRVKDLLEIPGVIDATHKATPENDDFFLESNHPYLLALAESLNLPAGISARGFNKSGRARIGTAVKLVSDNSEVFDRIPRGYSGPLYAEVSATTFPELVRLGKTTMPQIRFYFGEPVSLEGLELWELLKRKSILVDKNGKPLTFPKLKLDEICRTGQMTFTADLSRPLLAYRANKDRKTIDLEKKKFYDPRDFFSEVRNNRGGLLTIHPGEFVLIHSNELIRLPPEYAAEIDEYSPELGDMKSHYAGLVNPGHGYSKSVSGGHIVFEVRARDSPIILQHGQALAKFKLFEMAEPPQQDYEEQKTTRFDNLQSILPSQFRRR